MGDRSKCFFPAVRGRPPNDANAARLQRADARIARLKRKLDHLEAQRSRLPGGEGAIAAPPQKCAGPSFLSLLKACMPTINITTHKYINSTVTNQSLDSSDRRQRPGRQVREFPAMECRGDPYTIHAASGGVSEYPSKN